MKRLLLLMSGFVVMVALFGVLAGDAQAATEAQKEQCKNAGGVPVSTIWDRSPTDNSPLGDECLGSDSQNPIFSLISAGIRWFSAIFGLILVLIVAVAGFQYVISAGDSDQIKGAKERLKAAVTGLVLYLLMFSILQFLLPEGAKVFR